MWMRLLVGVAAVGLLLVQPAYGQGEGGPDLKQARDRIVELANRFRHDHDLSELKVNDKLTATAQDFADFMARTDKYGHTADGKEPWQRGKEHGYAYCYFEENIAWQENPAGFSTEALAKGFEKAWEESPPHRKNLLNPDVTEFGVGVAYSSHSGRYYAVQDFGRPKSDQVEFQVSNPTDAEVRFTLDGTPQKVPPGYTMTYHSCMSPKLVFEGSGKEGNSDGEEKVYHPEAGTRYVIRKNEAGGYSLAEK